MRTITFYSYKGGVGRTLAIANVAKYLAQLGNRVFVIDFDLEAPGVHHKLGVDRGGSMAPRDGLLDVLVEFHENRRLPETLGAFVHEIKLKVASSGTLHLLAAGDAPSAAYWRKLSMLDWHAMFYADEPEGVPMFLELKAQLEEQYAPDFLLIDARTGITEMGGVATTVLSNQVVCFTLGTLEHLEGTRAVMRAIQRAPRLESEEKIKLTAVLSRMPQRAEKDERAELERVREFLNESDEDLSSTLALDEVFALHREAMLEEREQLLVGGGRNVDDSMLLRDYIRLFSNFIPKSALESSLGPMIADIERRVFSEPDDAERSMEELVRACPHPDAYHALLRMYKVRRSSAEKRLHCGRTLWSITRDPKDPLLSDVVEGFSREHLDSFLRDPSLDELAFIHAIWTANGAQDSTIALQMSRWFQGHGKMDHAESVLHQLAANARNPSPDAVARLIDLRREKSDFQRALTVVQQFKEMMASSPRFLEAWAELAFAMQVHHVLSEMLADTKFSIDLISKHRPVLTTRLHLFLGKRGEVAPHFDGMLKGWLTKRPRREVLHAGVLARELGRDQDFLAKLKREVPANDYAVYVDEIAAMPNAPDDFGYDGGDDIPF